MGDDWDPFADPAGTAETDASADVKAEDKQAAGTKHSTDIVAALTAPPREANPNTAEEFGALLDDFFSVANDVNFEIIEDAFRPIAAAIDDDNSLRFQLWKKGVPMMQQTIKEIEKGESPTTLKVFGLLVDDLLGVNMNMDNNWPSPVRFDKPPSGEPCGRVIFLFGWGGATCPDMDDMVELYHGLFPGAAIMRLESNRGESWGLRVQCAAAIRAATWAWKAMKVEARPQLLVHLFSNGGFFTWEEMLASWKALSDREEEVPELGMPLPPMSEVLRGVILDSAPDATPEVKPQIQSLAQSFAPFYRAVVASDHDGSEKGKKDAEARSKRAVLEFIGTSSPVTAYLNQKPGADRFVLAMCSARSKKVQKLEPLVPLQFIYSLADTIIRYQGIEDYLSEVEERRKQEGLPPPRRLRFDKTRHALHKVEKRDEYVSCVRAFATEVLSTESG